MTYQGSEKHQSSISLARSKANRKSPCPHCNLGFTSGNWDKHERSCTHKPGNERYCNECSIQIYKLESNGSFCSRTCAAKRNNRVTPKRVRKNLGSFLCLSCSKEQVQKHNSKGLYCNAVCQQNHQWETVTKPRIMTGECTEPKTIRRFLIERDGPGCSDCGTIEWKGTPMTMDVDHIDGDHTNNSPDNFRLLCPNCHRQTPTWGKKNPKRYGTSSLRYTPV